MANVCKSLANTAGAPCAEQIKPAKRIILVPEKDATGTKNEIANVAGVTLSALQAKFDAANTLDRFYPLPLLENTSDIRAETEFFEYEGGKKAKIRSGSRTFMGWLPWESTISLSNYKNWEGQSFGVYIIDDDGNFIYYTDSSGVKVQPLIVDGDSLDFMEVRATKSEPGYIKVQFDFSDNMHDENIRFIPFEDLDFDGRDTSDVYGLTDAVLTAGSTYSDTSMEFSIATIYGTVLADLTLSDIAVYNETQSVTLTPDSITEDAVTDGSYTLDMSTEHTASNITTGDTVRITLRKDMYDRDYVSQAVT